MIRAGRAAVRKYTTLPIRDELVSILRAQNFGQLQAEKLVDSIDAAVMESDSWRHLSLEEYEKLLFSYQQGVEGHCKELQQTEETNNNSLTNDFEFLLGQINRTRQRIKDEAQQLESNVQLDLNLERKRRGEVVSEIAARSKDAEKYVEAKSEEIRRQLGSVSRQALTAIATFATAILASFVSYKFLYD